MTVSTTKMTAEQFLMLGDDPPGVRLELSNGEIAVSPSASFGHSFLDTKLRTLLSNHIDAHDLGALVGDVDTIFDHFNVRRPDLIFIAKARMPQIIGRAITIPPDLCVEILSPSSAMIDQGDKFELYARHGVANYWLLDPKARTFAAYRLEDGRYVRAVSGREAAIVRAEPFPALALPLGDLWPPVALT